MVTYAPSPVHQAGDAPADGAADGPDRRERARFPRPGRGEHAAEVAHVVGGDLLVQQAGDGQAVEAIAGLGARSGHPILA